MKRVLITGADSYIGDSVKDYLAQYPDNYSVDIIDTIGWEPSVNDFQSYDVVFNVAGIAHIRETDDNRHLYYAINQDLAIKIGKAAKEAGVRQYILLSSMSVYGLTTGHITKKTQPQPINAYGKSKLGADEVINKLDCDTFRFACLRPPMVYGKGCKGNYQLLRKFALKSPLFPAYNNSRSMVYIGNLCEFIKCCIDDEKRGLFFPQNAEYVETSQMVRLIASCNGKRIKMTKAFNLIIEKMHTSIIEKVFGNLTYEKIDTVEKYSFADSIRLSEK